jgi:hypothetical protein
MKRNQILPVVLPPIFMTGMKCVHYLNKKASSKKYPVILESSFPFKKIESILENYLTHSPKK